MKARELLGVFAIVLAGCAGEIGAPPEAGDGAAPASPYDRIHEEIVGGRSEAGYPAVGALLGPRGGLCTATVIAPRWIVTAAHCFARAVDGHTFVLGSSLRRPARAVRIAEVRVHPDFDPWAIANDIALARLADDPGVDPLPLVDSLAGREGDWLTFVGFGLTSGDGGSIGEKRSVRMPIARLGDTTFVYATPGRNTCRGDSGGPAFVVEGRVPRVAGVTSYGDARCRSFGVDTRVDAYRDWIAGLVGDGAPADCGDLDYLGECRGAIARWCDGGRVRARDCAADGMTCGWIDDALGYYCHEPADPCADLDYLGRCRGDTAEWCDGDRFLSRDCAADGKTCGWLGPQLGYYCRD